MEHKFESIEKSMCKELENIERKLESGQEMSSQDLDRIDKLAHAMKSLATYMAMKEAEEYEGMSGARGRGADGRYVSRESSEMSSRQSYDDGYSRGYSEAMNQMSNQMNRNNNSGHYPAPNYYEQFPRWR